MPTLPASFKERIVSIHGPAGQKWLDSLPAVQTGLIQHWSLGNIQPVPDPSYNYLVFCSTAAGERVVLKMGVPHAEFRTEIMALQAFNGHGVVRILKAAPELGAMLLERILPGDNLLSIKDDRETTRIAARVMKKIWITAPPDNDFPTAASWCLGFQRYQDQYPGNGPYPLGLVSKASYLANELLASSQNQLLLHGDLHHMNVLSGESPNWIAIDPKGVIGEPAFEVGALLMNPIPDLIHWPDLKAVLRQRLDILEEELGIGLDRLTAWSFVRAVLSAIWSLEDGEDWNSGIKIACVLGDLI